LLVSSSAHALRDDIEKPVHINADSVLFNKTKGLAVYEGNVSIVQGSLDIRAAKIEINAPNNEIVKISANGSPVSFQQKMDNGKLAKGKANRVTYLVKEKRLFLDGNAVISQNNDKFSSDHIEYSMSSGELKAGNKKAPGKNRVKAIFYPSNKSK
jgi:lipopolysaccharide export system protein LptA